MTRLPLWRNCGAVLALTAGLLLYNANFAAAVTAAELQAKVDAQMAAANAAVAASMAAATGKTTTTSTTPSTTTTTSTTPSTTTSTSSSVAAAQAAANQAVANAMAAANAQAQATAAQMQSNPQIAAINQQYGGGQTYNVFDTASNQAYHNTLVENAAKAAGGKGDPLLQAFDGTTFFFHGEPGRFYNLASAAGEFQVTAQLKEANNAVHTGAGRNGTYVQAIGYKHGSTQVSVETYADDSSRTVVRVDGQLLELAAESRTRTFGGADEMKVAFQPHAAGLGTTVTIDTPSLELVVYLVPPGLDKHNFWQSSYLNFDLKLKKTPEADLQGVLGETFHSTRLGTTAKAEDDRQAEINVPPYINLLYPLFPDAAYEIESLFANPSFSFTGSFLHGMIFTRKAVVNGLVPFLASPQPTAATPASNLQVLTTHDAAKEENLASNKKQPAGKTVKAARKLGESMRRWKVASAEKVTTQA